MVKSTGRRLCALAWAFVPIAFLLGQQQDDGALLFGPGVFSTGLYELTPTFAPDGNMAYFTVSTPAYGRLHVIMETHLVEGTWASPRVASFSGQYGDADPMFSPDGSKLFFLSRRPIPGSTAPKREFDIWVVERQIGGDWGTPRHIPEASGPKDEHYVSIASDGTLYISAVRSDINGPQADIYKVPMVNGRYAQPENLGSAINTIEGHETTPWVAPDQSYMVFGARRPGTAGIDLFISFRRENKWTTAKSLGPLVNSTGNDYCPIGSPDGQWLYFSSDRGFAGAPPDAPFTTAQWIEKLTNPGNSLGDTYRIPIAVIIRETAD
ncbi:MAG: hypothetical protein WEB62_03770 [Bacteroidota bacterium]